MYFRVSIHNPNVTKVSFQLTTIHGDPDIFISTTEKTPTPYAFEKRSIRCGIFPEQVEYVAEANKTLDGEYYITVYGYVQSTFSLVYYTEVLGDEHHTPKVKLSTGKSQKGTLKSTQDSMVYFFKLSNDMSREEVEVRLTSENGRFKFYVGMNFIPDDTKFTLFGDEVSPVILSIVPNEELDLQTYYIRVVPQQLDDSTVN